MALLKEHVASGKVTARTKWSSQYLLVVKHEDAYHAMCSNTAGSTPRELFDDQVESLVEALDKDKGVVKVRFEHRWKHTVSLSVCLPTRSLAHTCSKNGA